MNILTTHAEITEDHLANLMRILKRLFFDFIYVRARSPNLYELDQLAWEKPSRYLKKNVVIGNNPKVYFKPSFEPIVCS